MHWTRSTPDLEVSRQRSSWVIRMHGLLTMLMHSGPGSRLPIQYSTNLFDLGSGLGHVALLAFMLTGVRSFGIEVEAAYVASAQACAHSLQLYHVRFIHEDARAADLSIGTVFYLYSPFSGSILADVLHRLE